MKSTEPQKKNKFLFQMQKKEKKNLGFFFFKKKNNDKRVKRKCFE
jgi:hypothetical protein